MKAVVWCCGAGASKARVQTPPHDRATRHKGPEPHTSVRIYWPTGVRDRNHLRDENCGLACRRRMSYCLRHDTLHSSVLPRMQENRIEPPFKTSGPLTATTPAASWSVWNWMPDSAFHVAPATSGWICSETSGHRALMKSGRDVLAALMYRR